MRLAIEHRLAEAEIDDLYAFYQDAFRPLMTRATARHVLTVEEFAAEMTDRRIDKYVARHDSGQALGLATLTTDITAVPWVEPHFYRARFPEQVAGGTLFYLGYILTAPTRETLGVAKALTDAIFERCTTSHGVLAFDTCAFNGRRGVGKTLARLPERYGASIELLDTQTYYGVTF